MMTHVWEKADGTRITAAKGALDALIADLESVEGRDSFKGQVYLLAGAGVAGVSAPSRRFRPPGAVYLPLPAK